MKKVLLAALMTLGLTNMVGVQQAEARDLRWAWADLAAGLATAEMGPISFVIGGCASMAAAPAAAIKIDFTPSPTFPPNPFDITGINHDKFISTYASMGGGLPVDYNLAKEAAKKVTPQYAEQIDALDVEQMQSIVNTVKTYPKNTPDDILNIIKIYTTTTQQADQIILANLTTIMNADDPIQATINFERIIPTLPEDKAANDNLLLAMAILRNSTSYWYY